MDEPWVDDALSIARVARLGTVGPDNTVRLVPVCFAIVDGWLVSAVDHYDNEDWSNLWWVRIHGRTIAAHTD